MSTNNEPMSDQDKAKLPQSLEEIYKDLVRSIQTEEIVLTAEEEAVANEMEKSWEF